MIKHPVTPRDDKAKVYKIPIEKSDIVKPGPKGIIPHKYFNNN